MTWPEDRGRTSVGEYRGRTTRSLDSRSFLASQAVTLNLEYHTRCCARRQWKLPRLAVRARAESRQEDRSYAFIALRVPAGRERLLRTCLWKALGGAVQGCPFGTVERLSDATCYRYFAGVGAGKGTFYFLPPDTEPYCGRLPVGSVAGSPARPTVSRWSNRPTAARQAPEK
jgi:hypothetical protein